jgi:hypothetical protein
MRMSEPSHHTIAIIQSLAAYPINTLVYMQELQVLSLSHICMSVTKTHMRVVYTPTNLRLEGLIGLLTLQLVLGIHFIRWSALSPVSRQPLHCIPHTTHRDL